MNLVLKSSSYYAWDESVLSALEVRTEAFVSTFTAFQVENMLWAYGKMKKQPGAGLMRGLEWRAEALADTFGVDRLSSTLWAYSAIGRPPGGGLMRKLERRLEALAGKLKADEVAQFLYVFTTTGMEPSARLMTALEGRVEALAHTFTEQGVLLTYKAYATMGREPGAGAMRGLEGRVKALAGTFNAENVATTLWAYGTMGREPGAGLIRLLEARAEALAGTFDTQDVATTLWAYGTMRRQPGLGLMRVLEGRVKALAGTFNAENVATTLWAYAMMERAPGAGLMRGLEARAEAVAGTFNSQNVAKTLWAYVKMELEPGAGLMRKIELRLDELAGTFKAQEVARMLWAYGTMGREPGERLMRKLELRLEALAGTFDARDVPRTLWAYATMGREPGAGLMRVLDRLAEALGDRFNAEGVATTLYSYVKMGLEPGEDLMRVLEGRAQALEGTFNSEDVANTLWAYGTMGREPGAGMMRMLEGLLKGMAGTFTAQGVANTLWAYGNMGREPGAGLMRELEGLAEALAGTFNVQDVANTLWAYATMGREPGAGLMRVLEARAEALVGTMSAQHVANTLWAYAMGRVEGRVEVFNTGARCGRAPSAGLMRGLEARAEAVAGTCTSRDVANTLWAYGKLGLVPGPRLMQGLEGRAEALAGTFDKFEATMIMSAYDMMRLDLPTVLKSIFASFDHGDLFKSIFRAPTGTSMGRGKMPGMGPRNKRGMGRGNMPGMGPGNMPGMGRGNMPRTEKEVTFSETPTPGGMPKRVVFLDGQFKTRFIQPDPDDDTLFDLNMFRLLKGSDEVGSEELVTGDLHASTKKSLLNLSRITRSSSMLAHLLKLKEEEIADFQASGTPDADIRKMTLKIREAMKNIDWKGDLPGGLMKGDFVSVICEFECRGGEGPDAFICKVEYGDTGIVFGATEDALADHDHRVCVKMDKKVESECPNAKIGRTPLINFHAALQIKRVEIASYYRKGDRVTSLINVPSWDVKKGDDGVVVGYPYCDVDKITNGLSYVCVWMSRSKTLVNFAIDKQIEHKRLVGDFQAGEMVHVEIRAADEFYCGFRDHTVRHKENVLSIHDGLVMGPSNDSLIANAENRLHVRLPGAGNGVFINLVAGQQALHMSMAGGFRKGDQVNVMIETGQGSVELRRGTVMGPCINVFEDSDKRVSVDLGPNDGRYDLRVGTEVSHVLNGDLGGDFVMGQWVLSVKEHKERQIGIDELGLVVGKCLDKSLPDACRRLSVEFGPGKGVVDALIAGSCACDDPCDCGFAIRPIPVEMLGERKFTAEEPLGCEKKGKGKMKPKKRREEQTEHWTIAVLLAKCPTGTRMQFKGEEFATLNEFWRLVWQVVSKVGRAKTNAKLSAEGAGQEFKKGLLDMLMSPLPRTLLHKLELETEWSAVDRALMLDWIEMEDTNKAYSQELQRARETFERIVQAEHESLCATADRNAQLLLEEIASEEAAKDAKKGSRRKGKNRKSGKGEAKTEEPAEEPAEDVDMCLICLEESSQGNLCNKLPCCSYMVHEQCMFDWKKKCKDQEVAVLCPGCRTQCQEDNEGLTLFMSRLGI